MRIWLTAGTVVLALTALAALAWMQSRGPTAVPNAAEPSPWAGLSEAADRFPDPPAKWTHRFPEDHGDHPEQFGEYWFFAGRLNGIADNSLGFRLAFYRLALAPDPPARESAWAAHQMYWASLVLEEPSASWAHADERVGRGALGLAGSDELRVWVEDWAAEHDLDCRCFRLRANAGGTQLQLTLWPPPHDAVPIAGIPGLGTDQPGSHGYWWSGWQAEGYIKRDADQHAVEGQALVEHFWGRRLPLAQGQLTLNRLWLELADGSALRCLQLRRRGAGGIPLGQCLWLSSGNEPALLPREALAPTGPSLYDHPLRWTLESPAAALALQAEAAQPRPPPDLLLPGWSGLLQTDGTSGGQPVQGWGWLELGGY
ncbi:lipocalin-like domain-containing protein [Thioalkalivibrio nitratireducens]|uniref:lipocalin-like domain-containing protein n=1 Tax=Thioalkalivibrio nitratireducens TaxID=186931 RepID=UPI000302EADE|nr:lipocalin-like domain-containing protein [Thioalkalivibrio nitratireducens]